MMLVLFFHAWRLFLAMGALFLVWVLDYAYVFFHRTYRLDFVDFERLDGGATRAIHMALPCPRGNSSPRGL